MTQQPDQPVEPDEAILARRLTEPRDSLPDDPLAAVVDPQFPPALRGYDRDTVDAYVERVTRLVAEMNASRTPRAAVREALERVGEETADILRRAHETADDLTTRARTDADELSGRTRREADELASRAAAEAQVRLDEAKREADGMIAEAQQRAQDLDRDADIIWQERARLIDDVRRLADEMQGVAHAADERYPPGPEEAAAEDEPIAPFDAEVAPLQDLGADVDEVEELAAAEPEDEVEELDPDATVEIPADELAEALADEESEPESEGTTAEWEAEPTQRRPRDP